MNYNLNINFINISTNFEKYDLQNNLNKTVVKEKSLKRYRLDKPKFATFFNDLNFRGTSE